MKGYWLALNDWLECSSDCYVAERAVKDKLQLWLKVSWSTLERCAASQFDLLEGDLGVFIYTALLHQRKVGHLGCYRA